MSIFHNAWMPPAIAFWLLVGLLYAPLLTAAGVLGCMALVALQVQVRR
jgi:hypothetical protein